ncbi:MAG: rhodanese-like domain-containing protein [Moraxella sp.]|nr:rhodanese-like domain-containing protein [Moraxella sp.]
MIERLAIENFVPSEDKVIWDVRDGEAFAKGHIKYAVNRPVDSLNPELLAATEGDIYVLCGGGTKAERAVALLHGFDENRRIVHLTGGTRQAAALGWTLIEED